MFRFKSVVLSLILFSCSSPVEEKSTIPEDTPHIKIINETDSILSYADEKMIKIKQHQIEQKVFVDSLQHTIEEEQFTINDLNKEVERRRNVDNELHSTRIVLENALKKCREKEAELEQLNEKFALKSEAFMDEIEYYVDREIKLITSYSHKMDSLEKVIELLKQKPNIEKKDKRRNRKR